MDPTERAAPLKAVEVGEDEAITSAAACADGSLLYVVQDAAGATVRLWQPTVGERSLLAAAPRPLDVWACP